MFEDPNRGQFTTPERTLEAAEISQMVERATQVNTAHQLDLRHFVEAYGAEKVQADYQAVAEKMSARSSRRMETGEKLGHIFEAAFLDSASRHNWFGEHSELIKASKYDDEMNGIDMVTTIMDEQNNVRTFEIASDLTISSIGMAEKMNRIKGDIERNKLATINYFHSDVLGFTGMKTNVPRTVIGLEPRNLATFLRQWQQEPELAQEQFGKLLTKQISVQSLGFMRLAGSTVGRGTKTYERYAETRQTAEDILGDLEDVALPEDKTLTNLQHFADSMKNH